MEKPILQDKIAQIIDEETKTRIEPTQYNTSLLKNGFNLDSLDIAAASMRMDDELNITIPEEPEQYDTINKIAIYLYNNSEKIRNEYILRD